MSYFEFADRLYEFTATSPSGTDDWVIECVELSNPDGFFGWIRIPPDSSQATLQTRGRSELPIAVVRHWSSLVVAATATDLAGSVDESSSDEMNE